MAAQDPVSALRDTVAEIQETAEPLFDPEEFDAAHPKLTEEARKMAELDQEKTKFFREQALRRREFLIKLKQKGKAGEKFRKELKEFNEDEAEKTDKFLSKIRKEIDKMGPEKTPIDELEQKKKEFLDEQKKEREEKISGWLKDLRANKISQEKFSQNLQRYNQKDKKEAAEFFKDYRKDILETASHNEAKE